MKPLLSLGLQDFYALKQVYVHVIFHSVGRSGVTNPISSKDFGYSRQLEIAEDKLPVMMRLFSGKLGCLR